MDLVAGIGGLGKAQPVDAVVGQHRPLVGPDEQPGRERQHQVAVGHQAVEDRAAGRGLFVHVGVELVAGALREGGDVGPGDGAGPGGDRVAHLQVVEGELERVPLVLLGCGAADVLAGHGGEHVGRTLHRGALHVGEHAPHAAHLLAAAGSAGPAVHQRRQGRPVAGAGRGHRGVHEQHPAVVRGDPGGERGDLIAVGAVERRHEAAPAGGDQFHGLVEGAVGHEGRDRPEGLSGVDGLGAGVGGLQQGGRHERPGRGVDAGEVAGVDHGAGASTQGRD